MWLVMLMTLLELTDAPEVVHSTWVDWWIKLGGEPYSCGRECLRTPEWTPRDPVLRVFFK